MELLVNKMSSWHIPQRQSPAAILVILGQISLQLLKAAWPFVVLYFLKGEKSDTALWFLWTVVAFGSLSLIGTFITYWFKKFYLSDNHLIVQSGWLRKKNLSIPFQNIQAVHLEQNIWQQAMDVSKVSFDATGSEKVEVQLEALPTRKAEELKRLLMDRDRPEGDETLGENSPQAAYKLSFANLLKLSLTANHLEAFLLLLLFGFNLMGEIRRFVEFDEHEFLGEQATELMKQTAYVILFLLSAVAIVSLIFSIVRTFLKYFDFSLIDNAHSWKISYGLFNKQQKTIPINKIQIISWRSSWLRRKFDYWIFSVQSVGHSKKNIKQHVLIPIMDSGEITNLASAYHPFSGMDPAESQPIERAYWKRKAIFIGLPLAILPTVISWFWLDWWAMGFLMLFIYVLGHYYVAWTNFRWQTVPKGLQIVSGAWGRKITLLKWSKIQQVHIHQSPYQRRKKLANVVFLTAGGRVILPYLSLEKAIGIADKVLFEVESGNEGWL